MNRKWDCISVGTFANTFGATVAIRHGNRIEHEVAEVLHEFLERQKPTPIVLFVTPLALVCVEVYFPVLGAKSTEGSK